jgi:flagellar hook-length control protein FliK
MNLSALPQLLAAWLKTQGTALLEPGKATPPAAKDNFQPGATYQGKVLENLASGRNLVQVGGQQLSMALPRGAQAGDSIRLTYLHNVPRPTFVMEQPAISATQPVRLSHTAQQLTALAQLARPTATARAAPPPTTPSPAQLTQAGVVVQRPILANTAPLNPTATPGTAGAATTPGATATPGAPQLTQAGAVAQRPILANTAPLASPPSVSGGSTVAMNAPTGVFATATALTGGTPVDGTRASLPSGLSTSNLAALQPGVASTEPALPQRLHQTLRESGLFYESHLARWTRGTFELSDLRNEPQARLGSGTHTMATAAGLTGMPEEAARLAGRQLLMLEGAPFFWQGFAWPGQWLEWQVQEHPGGEAGTGEEANTWATELRLTLPRMGGITARLSLAGERLTVGLSASEPAAREAMSAALPNLERALQAAGLKPAGLSVGQLDAATA